jgi:capsular exopolysaccharide synthesis family protein
MQKELRPIFDEAGGGSGNPISFHKVLNRVFEYWPWFAGFIAVTFVIAYLYLRYSTPIYLIHAKIFIAQNSNTTSPEGQVLHDLGIENTDRTLDNEIEILKSRYLMLRVADSLNLDVKYLAQGRVKRSELYNDGPFLIEPLYAKDSIKQSYAFPITISGGGLFSLTDGTKKHEGTLGDTVELSCGKLVITPNAETREEFRRGGDFIFTINPIANLAKGYANALVVEPVNKQVSILKISLEDILPERGRDIIRKLIEEYIAGNVHERNRVVEGTLNFIDERLIDIKADLTGVEKNIEQFKSLNNFIDLNEQSKALAENASSLTREASQYEVQLKVVESLESYLSNTRNKGRVVPSTLFIEDVTLTNLINKYNLLQTEKESLLLASTESSPYISNIENRLRDTRSDIITSLNTVKRSLQISVNEINRRNAAFNDRIKSVPAKERMFLEYSRQQNIVENLYLFLLKKREETAISRSATVASARIIDPVESEDVPVAPLKSKVFLAAFVAGLMVPATGLIIKELLNNRLSAKSDINRVSEISVVGEIGHSAQKETLAIKKDSRSQLAEQFRMLRTNIQFLLAGEDEKTILITSSMSGEGKSFIAINLACSLAIMKKRVVLLELDLRKPKISSHLNIDNSTGFSNYAIGKASIADIVKPSGLFDDLFVVSSGVIPPNPAELISMQRSRDLFEHLKREFDYVILDTAPIGLVTDAQLLAHYADVTLFVARQNYTFKQQLVAINDLFVQRKLPRMHVVMNDVKLKSGYGAYAYSYGYGSYNGYFDVEKNGKESRISRIKNRIRNKY